jgi:uncharacterized protein (DUF885 family)
MTSAPAFAAWLDAVFASYFRQRPVNATFVGMHAHDDRLPDFSELGMADTLAETDHLLRRLRALPDEPLSQAEQMDRELAEGFLLIQRWEAQSAHFDRGNPVQFTGEAIFGVLSLLLRNRPLVEQAEARLAAIPGFLGQAALDAAPAAWIARAQRECLGARLLLEGGIDIAFPQLNRAAHAAARAFAQFEARLAHAEPTQQYACGGEALDLLLRHAHHVDPDELERLALAYLADDAAIADRPSAQHGDSDTAYYQQVWQSIWQTDLVSRPEWPVRFVPRPAWLRQAAPYLYFLAYRSPPPLDPPSVVDYFVPPTSDETSIKLNHVVHHASLGHHVQNWFALRAGSRIGRVAAVDCASRIAMLCGGSIAEGWACYATDLADQAGLLTEAEQMVRRQTRRRMAARALVDIRLHQGHFGLADAVDCYVQQAGMSPAAAEAEAVKNSLFPGAAGMYLAGWEGIWRLRREHASAASLRAFHDRLLSFGSVPVALIARAMSTGRTHAASPRVPALGGHGR